MTTNAYLNRWSKGLVIIIVSILLIAVLFHVVSADSIERILVLRVPLLAGIILFFLPAIAFYRLPRVLENIFILEGSLRLAAVIIQAAATGLGIVFVWLVIDINAGCRFLAKSCSETSDFLNASSILPYLWGAGLAMPVILSCASLADIKKHQKLQGIVIGVITFLALYYLIYNLRQNDSFGLLDTVENFLVWFLNFVLPEPQRAGFINPDTGKLSGGHLLALSFTVVTFAIYAICYRKYRPSDKTGKWQAPALYYLLILIAAFTFILGLLTFTLDYYRIPTLLILLAVSWGLFSLFKTDHFFKLKESNKKRSVTVQQVLKKRLAINDDGTLVVICASGGGIQAAGWMTMILIQLQRRLGQSFANAIGLVSAVSGGSVGAMHYLDCMTTFPQPDKKQLSTIFENATKNSLDAIGWGFAYPDLWRIMGAPFVPSKMNDRGNALETDWKAVMYDKDASFDRWYPKMSDGKVPIAVFNATQVEYGRRLLFSPISFSNTTDNSQIDFNSLYKNYDVCVTTAARLSATFAYVSPIARDNKNVQPCHVADGGYFDNYGVFTANQWLIDEVLPFTDDFGIKRIIYIEIRASAAQPQPEQQVETMKPEKSGTGWLMALLGPLLTLANVRDATQNARNDHDINMLSRCQNNNVEFHRFVFEFPSKISFFETQAPEMVNKFTDKLSAREYKPPLSWKLSKKQKKAIWQGWYRMTTKPEESSYEDWHNLLRIWNEK